MVAGNRPSSFGLPPGQPLDHRHGGRLSSLTGELSVHGHGDDYTVDDSGTITGLPTMPVGTTVYLRFTGSPTFVHSTSLVCPNAQNFQASAGNVALLRSDGDGVWRVYASPAIYDVMTLSAAQQDQARANIGVMGRNKIINGGFTVNQRAYVSAATLASGAYGHDRWKGGASGGNYSYSQLASPTTINITSSKSIIQVIEDKNVEGGTYTLSWSGIATARVGINSATPSGNFAVSPITFSGQTAGTTMSVEFTGANAAGGSTIATNTGTVGSAQLEAASIATPFDFRLYPQELALCQRYGELTDNFVGKATAATTAEGVVKFSTPKRAVPTTPTIVNGTNSLLEVSVSLRSFTGVGGTPQIGCAYVTFSGLAGLTAPNMIISDAAGFLFFDSEL